MEPSSRQAQADDLRSKMFWALVRRWEGVEYVRYEEALMVLRFLSGLISNSIDMQDAPSRYRIDDVVWDRATGSSRVKMSGLGIEDLLAATSESPLVLPEEFAPVEGMADLFGRAFPMMREQWVDSDAAAKREACAKVYAYIRKLCLEHPSGTGAKYSAVSLLICNLNRSCAEDGGEVWRIISTEDRYMGY